MNIKPAATLVLLRDGAVGPELLMIERATTMGFAAGAMVFPGGKVDAADHALAADTALTTGFVTLERDDAVARVAALRETFEEVGILVGAGPELDEAERSMWRRRLVRHETDFAAFLRATGHRLDAAALVPFARWCPPERLERSRFDTRFYLARLPAGETALHDGEESLSSRWVGAAEALAQADAGQSRIIFPTRRNLERLALHSTIDAVIAAAVAIPVRLVEPWTEERGGVPHLCIRDDCGYPVTSEPEATARRG